MALANAINELVTKQDLETALTQFKRDILKWTILLLLAQIGLFAAINGGMLAFFLRSPTL